MKKQIKVYVTSYWRDDRTMLNEIKKYGFGSTTWKNVTFVTGDEYDKVVILTNLFDNNREFNYDNTTKFLTEPPCFPRHILTDYAISPMYMPLSWWIYYKNCDCINTEISFLTTKTELLSTVTSDKQFWDGHKKRTKFLLALDGLIDEGLDIYGRKYYGGLLSNMKNYKGELIDKFEGLIPYRYHFTCENSFIPDYFTEKIIDPLVAETLCFYDGCSNIEEYIDERAFIRIDVTQIEAAIEKIFTSIRNDEYKKRYPYILAQKKRMLTELNPLNIIWAQINGKDLPDYFKL